jgi:hypothetical protein
MSEANIFPNIPVLLPKLTQILKTTPHDPAVPVSLSMKLLRPISFAQVLTLADEGSLTTALRSPAPAANILAMSILSKASNSPSDAAILSMMPNLVEEFLHCWLSSADVEVGENGSKVLGDILEVDCELSPPVAANGINGTEVAIRKTPGQGRMWRRIFREERFIFLIVSHCKGTAQGQTPRQTTLAQGRVLRILPRLAALNFAAVTISPYSFLRGGGLLQFAALHMIDKSDALMHLSQIDFFESFLSIMRVTEYTNSKMTTIRSIVREAADDDAIKQAILTLPDRTVPEEAELLRAFIREIMAQS